MRCGTGGIGDHVAARTLAPERKAIGICTDRVCVGLNPACRTGDLRRCALPGCVIQGGEFVFDRYDQVAVISEFTEF